MTTPIVKFTSVDIEARTVTFDVGGQQITRDIPQQFFGTIDDYITALGRGLEVEFTTVDAKAIETPTIKSGDRI